MLVFKLNEIEEAVKTSLIAAYNQVENKNDTETILKKGFEIIETYRFKKQLRQPKIIPNTANTKRIAEIKNLLKNPDDLSKNETLKLKAELVDLQNDTIEVTHEQVTWSGVCSQNGEWNTYKRLADFSKIPVINPFNHKADTKKFIEACQHLFPNVDAFHVGLTMTNFANVIQNVYANLGVTKHPEMIKMFYQYSALGGTGKTIFNNKLFEFLRKVNLPVEQLSFVKGRWVGCEYSKNLVVIDNEYFPPKRNNDTNDAISNLNKVLDNDFYTVEYKGQDSYSLKSRATAFVNSNFLPFDNNTRRWGIVYYNEVPWNNISNEAKEKYFKDIDWNKWFLQAFESCPFDTTWEDIECKNSNNLNDLIFAAREIIKHTDHLMIDINNATIREFTKCYLELMNDFGKVAPEAIKKQIYMWRNDIRKAVAQGLIVPSTRVNGNTDYSKYNLQDIANLLTNEDDLQNSLNDIDDVWERTQKAFENFKLDFYSDDDPPTNDDPTPKTDKLSDGWIFNDYFETSEGEKGFNKPEYENKMQKQVVINKPLEMKDEPTRKNEDVEQCNFLFEIDPPKYEDSLESLTMTKDEYYKKQKLDNLKKYVEPFTKQFRENIVWICDSGSKSTHIVLRTNNTNPEAREYIWKYFNNKYFEGKCDKACKNAARLARNPNAIRENGKKQVAWFIQENAKPLDVSDLVNNFEQERLAKKMQLELELRHLKKFSESNNASIEQQFEWIVNKTKSESLKLAYDIYTTKGVASGENMIGAIKAVQALGPKFSEIAIEVQNVCHNLHPSNITKAA